MTDSVRSLHATSELMHKAYAEIERQLDVVSIYCHEAGSTEYRCGLGYKCPFRDETDGCKAERMMKTIGRKME